MNAAFFFSREMYPVTTFATSLHYDPGELNVTGSKVDLVSKDIDFLKTTVRKALAERNSISFSLYPRKKGHIVRVQGIDEGGMYIDDPNGSCPLACKLDRQNCKTGYDKGTRNNSESSAGNNNFYSWSEIKK